MRQLCKAGVLSIVLTAALFFPKNGLSQDIKIAVVDVETLTLASDEGKVAAEKLKKKYDEFSGIMDKARKDIDDKETRLRTQTRVMSATAQAQLTREISEDKIVFDRKNQDYQRQMSDYQEELLAPIADKSKTALQTFIKDKGYSIVVDLSAEMGNVVWANPANDITQDIVKVLNEEYKKAGGVAPVTTTPATTGTTTTPRSATPAAGTARPPAGGAAAPAAGKP